MADYYPLIARAIAGLDPSAPGDQRRALYVRAREALIGQLRSVQPPLSEAEITRERLSLEEAVRKVESEAAQRARDASRSGAGDAARIRGTRGIAGALGGLGLDLAHGLFQRQPLAGDLGFAQRRFDAAQLRDQRGACPFIQRTAALAGSTGIQSGNGAGNQRVVVSHFCSTLQAFR